MALSDMENSYEGYLEKHGNNPVSRMRGKKKMWCYLLGSNLYCHTENKKTKLRQATSSITSTIDLTQAQMIKVPPSDKTKTQFEISTIFKSYIFTAPSLEECQIWVKKLQNAMTCDSQGSQSSNSRSANSVSSMSSSSSSQKSSSVHLSDGYSEVNDFVVQLRPKSGAANVAMETESSHYQSIKLEDDVFRNSSPGTNPPQVSQAPTTMVEEHSAQYATVIPKSERPVNKAGSESEKPGGATRIQEQTTHETSQKPGGATGIQEKTPHETSRKPGGTTGIQEQTTHITSQKPGGTTGIQEQKTHQTVNKSEKLNQINNQNNENISRISKSRHETFSDSDGESIDDIHSYIPEAFPEIPTIENPIPAGNHSAITELQKFLINNKLDRLSTSSFDRSSDPIQDLKNYLDSINI